MGTRQLSLVETSFGRRQHQPPVLYRCLVGGGEYPDELAFGATRCADPGDFSWRRHACRGRWRRRYRLRGLPPGLHHQQPGAGDNPARWRHAHPHRYLPRRAETGILASNPGRGDHLRLHRTGRGLAFRFAVAAGLADRCDRRLHRCRRGVQSSQRQGPERAGRLDPGNRIGQQRSDGDVSHRRADRHAARRPQQLRLGFPADSGSAVRHRHRTRAGRWLAAAAADQPTFRGRRALPSTGGCRGPDDFRAVRRHWRQRHPGDLRLWPAAGQPADSQSARHSAHVRRPGLAKPDRHVPCARAAAYPQRIAAHRPASTGFVAVDDSLRPAAGGVSQPVAVSQLSSA